MCRPQQDTRSHAPCAPAASAEAQGRRIQFSPPQWCRSSILSVVTFVVFVVFVNSIRPETCPEVRLYRRPWGLVGGNENKPAAEALPRPGWSPSLDQDRTFRTLTSAAISAWLTASHPNSEVKQVRAGVVLRWGTTREGPVLRFLFICRALPRVYIYTDCRRLSS